MSKQFCTPILFLIFNRPEITFITFQQLRLLRPSNLFIAADGPRESRPDETALCSQTRSIVDQIDWPCTVQTLFRDYNLGCGKAVSQAISWFFQHVDHGIILEDDCVPDPSFFEFCALLLDRYKNNENVMMISGTNFLFNKINSPESYFFSRCYLIWGWATWRRAWQKYDFEMKEWSPERADFLHQFYANKTIISHWQENFEKIRMRKIDTWDIQWVYTCIRNQGYALVPYTNLVSNIGLLGAHANGQKSFFHEMPVAVIDTKNLMHPARIIYQKKMDKITYNTIFKVVRPHYSIEHRVKNFLRPWLRFLGLQRN